MTDTTLSKAERLQGYFDKPRLSFPKIDELAKQLLKFPPFQKQLHDDMVDAFMYGIGWMKPYDWDFWLFEKRKIRYQWIHKV